ncbi:MAG: hypothetical protein H7A51_04370 [Akkermansiaceae bacterium]|nr:hypothetical protein [Akkermansiaceae bacterium]
MRSITLDEVLHHANVSRAWEKVRNNRGAAGEDSVSIAELESCFSSIWPGVETSIRQRRYQVAPLRPVSIPKPSGGRRKLLIPSVIDRIVQQSLASTFGRRWEHRFLDNSYAYRPGRGAHGAIQQVLLDAGRLSSPFGLRIDIQDFFDTVSRAQIERIIGETGCDEDVANLVHGVLGAPSASLTGPVARIAGIPQGSPLSPVISNAILHHFDTVITRQNIVLMRYADDMLMILPSEQSAHEAHKSAVSALTDLELRLNEKKTRIAPLNQISFLGFGFERNGLGQWHSQLPLETCDACRAHLRRMEDSAKSPAEMARFLNQWASYFLPSPEDRFRHGSFLTEIETLFHLPQSSTSSHSSRQKPPQARPPESFSYDGSSSHSQEYKKGWWAARFILRRTRMGLTFKRKGLLPIPSGLRINVAGHHFHIRF